MTRAAGAKRRVRSTHVGLGTDRFGRIRILPRIRRANLVPRPESPTRMPQAVFSIVGCATSWLNTRKEKNAPRVAQFARRLSSVCRKLARRGSSAAMVTMARLSYISACGFELRRNRRHGMPALRLVKGPGAPESSRWKNWRHRPARSASFSGGTNASARFISRTPCVSRRHARLAAGEHGPTLSDEESKAGNFFSTACGSSPHAPYMPASSRPGRNLRLHVHLPGRVFGGMRLRGRGGNGFLDGRKART